MTSESSSDELRMRITDAVCDQFERSWASGKQPNIASYLVPFGDEARSIVFEELLRVDLELRKRCGESPEPDEYVRSFPEFEARVAKVFEEEAANPPAPTAEATRLLALFRENPPFDETSSAVLEELLERAELRTWRPDAALLEQGKPSDELLLLSEGVAEVVHSSPVGERPITRVGPGTVLGEISVLTGEPCTANVVARGVVSALVLSREEYDGIARRHPSLPAALYDLVSRRIGRGLRDILFGRVVGDYRILELVGRGGAAVVYKGEPLDRPGEFVALKFLHHSLVTDHRAVQRFRLEYGIGQTLDHPNIVAVRDLFAAFGTHAMVQEYCEGSSLEKTVREQGRLDGRLVKSVVGQVASALVHAHDNGILHHDVTPANILLTENGTARLTDFGLAKSGDLDDLTAEQAIVGTPAYMPPECYGSMPLTRAADVYGLGCVALELWTGKTPVVGRSLLETASIRAAWTLPPREEIDPVPDDEFYGFLERALKHEPRERTIDLGELAGWAKPA